MIIDLQKFISVEQPFWQELEALLDKLEDNPDLEMSLVQVRRFHYLYQRTSSGLSRISTFSSEPALLRYLESLTARAYAEINEKKEKQRRFSPLQWFFTTFPSTFRLHIRAFWLAVAITFIGVIIGGGLIALDPEAKEIIMPFPGLKQSPSERVASEEKAVEDKLEGRKATGAAWYMTHNTKVAIFTFALGITWGIGTILVLFSNGIMMGAVVFDYIIAGETQFLIAWLSPHGVIEIPAILLAGQAGFLLAGAIIGRGRRASLQRRLRDVSKDLVTLITGVALMLTWAGFVEAFFSQYHEPLVPYSLKIGFAAVEFALLILYLGMSGRKRANE
jgi:uncharacterized membrane protein SpoIIM required for sporulation